MKRTVLVSAAMAVSLAASAHAATYNFLGLNNTTSNWSDAVKWSNTTGGGGTYPAAGDLAQFQVAVDNWTTIELQGGATVGSIYVKPRWGPYRIKTGWGGTPTFSVNNNGSDSFFTLGNYAGSNQTSTNLVIGADGVAMKLSLANNLVVQNETTSVNPGVVSIGANATIIGGSTSSRRLITTKAVNNYKITTSMSGAATFVGDWVVDGAKATLDMNTNAFGDASNSVDLLNGGTLDLNNAAFDAFSWNRSLSGTGTVIANTVNGFNIGTGSIDLAANGSTVDHLNITGNLVLGADSVLNLTGDFGTGTPVLISTTGTVTGTFGTVNAPAGYGVSYSGNSISVVVPEPAAIGLIGGVGVLVAGRRKRRA